MACVLPCSLHPPAVSAYDDAAAREKLPWVLLEVFAYVAKRDNATTASADTWDGKRIQVTLCARRPPHASYVCVHSPDAADIYVEPEVLAAEGCLLLLGVRVGRPEDARRGPGDFYVYEASDPPSLTRLPRLPKPYFLDASDIGVLPCPGGYVVAGLYRSPWGLPPGQFDLCLYDKRKREACWEARTVRVDRRGRKKLAGTESFFYHKNRKAVAIGGAAGTMAFVDLWRGIIFCDLLVVPAQASSAAGNGEGAGAAVQKLRYVPLPAPLRRDQELEGDSRCYRNISLVGGRLKYVELQLRYRGALFREGWMAAVWSRPATSSSSDGWREHASVMDSSCITAGYDAHSNLLPRVVNGEGAVLPLFRGVDVCQPVLGLDDDKDVVYFTTKRIRSDKRAWVVGVDLGKKELAAVIPFDARRYRFIYFSHVNTRISEHLPTERKDYDQ